MNASEIRRRALLAATKATLSVLAAGCGGQIDDSPPTYDAGSAGHAGSAPSGAGAVAAAGASGAGASGAGGMGGTGGAGVAATASPLCQGTQGPTFSSETIDCCGAVVTAYFPKNGPFPEGTAPPDVVTCCDVALSWFSSSAPTNSPTTAFDGANTFDCCSVASNPGSALCSPWGPPTPPAMPAWLVAHWEAWLADALEEVA